MTTQSSHVADLVKEKKRPKPPRPIPEWVLELIREALDERALKQQEKEEIKVRCEKCRELEAKCRKLRSRLGRYESV